MNRHMHVLTIFGGCVCLFEVHFSNLFFFFFLYVYIRTSLPVPLHRFHVRKS